MPFDPTDLEILERVNKRKIGQRESLESLRKAHPGTGPGALGIEGWLKVETIAALAGAFQIDKVQNKGIDLIISTKNNLVRKNVELKADTGNHFVDSEIEGKFPSTDILLYLKRTGGRELKGYQFERHLIGVDDRK